MSPFNVIVVVETFVCFLIAVPLHNAIQAGFAALLGDRSSVAGGRVSLSPLRQIAPIGTIVAIVFSIGSLGGLGWGKAVDVDARKMRVGPNFGLVLVGLAGIVSYLVIGIALLFVVLLFPGSARLESAYSTCLSNNGNFLFGGQALQGCLVNVQPAYILRIEQFIYIFALTCLVLAVLNVIPLAPLDGYRILYAFLPTPQALRFRSWEPYMELILLVIFFLVPYILAIANIAFSPGDILIQWGANIGQNVVGRLDLLFRSL
jgi:Zn-dependent protease